MTTRKPGALTVKDFSAWAGIGTTKIYEELAKGTLRAVKAGKRTLIPMESAEEWLRAQPAYNGLHSRR